MGAKLTTLPAPAPESVPGGYRDLRSFLAASPLVHDWLDAGFVRLGSLNVPPSVAATVGAASSGTIDELWVSTAGELTDYHPALSSVPECGANWLVMPRAGGVFDWKPESSVPWRRGIASCSPDIQKALRLFLSSMHLHGVTPRRSAEVLGQFLTHQEPPVVEIESFDGVRLAVVGYPIDRPALMSALERQRVSIIYVEWLQAACELRLTEDWSYELRRSPLVGGLEGRISRLRGLKRLHGVIVEFEPFCAHALDEVWVRGAVDVPVLALERARYGPLDAVSRNRLDAFLESVGRRHS